MDHQQMASCSSSPSSSMFPAAGTSAGGAAMAPSSSFLNMSGPGSSGGGGRHHQEEPEHCLVCNDVATGYHYGTPSCNGCKTFFRRTVMKKQVFQCQYDGNCPVDKSVRCACRHCRFKKCLTVGMNKDAIQQNRDPIGYTKRTRRYPLVKQQQILGGSFAAGPADAGCSVSSTPFPASVAPTPFSHHAGPSSRPPPPASSIFVNQFGGAPSSSSSSSGGIAGPSSSSPSTSASFISARAAPSTSAISSHQQQPPATGEQLQEDLLLQRLISIENILVTIRNSKISVQKSLNDLVLNRSIFEDPQMIKKMASEGFQMPNVLRRAEQDDYLYWHERDWFIMIEWAKMLPVYQQLSVSDKLALLRHSAITYPSLIQCFYTPDVGPDTIVFPNGAFFDRTLDPNKPTGFQRKNFKMLDNLLNPIRKMQIDQNEFSGAKGIFFLNPGNFEDDSDADDLSPEAKAQIAVARSAITNALYRYMVQKRGTEEAADKFGKLLLLGTAIATMSCEMKEAVVVADFFDQIRFSGFARQLLLAKDEDDLTGSGNAGPSSQNDNGGSGGQQSAPLAVQQPPPQSHQVPPPQQFFATTLPPTSTPVTTTSTMAMLNGLNTQIQQQMQQQHHNTLLMNAFNDLPPTNGQQLEGAMEKKQQMHQQQMQLQMMANQIGQQQNHFGQFGQTQLGPQSVQTVLPPQDQQPFTPAMFTSLSALQPQPPSAQSQQSFATTSPPSLINLT